MKTLYLNCIVILLITSFSSLHAQVGIGTTTPSLKSALDITSTTTGVLFPRVTTAQRTAIAPAGTDTGLKVYDTTTKSYWYWDGTIWVEQAANNNWNLTGNAGTTAGTNFIGTTDAQDLRIKTGVGGVDRWNISNTNSGQLQSYALGTAALPSYSFQTDQNTGVFSSGADQLDFSTNGTARFRIPAANQVHALALGTAALPFYTFSADSNTGVFSPVADNLAISTNGTEKVRVDTNGAVGIGTTTPNGALDVNATAANYGFVPPRVALTASNAQAPVTNPQGGVPATGTVVYNTAVAGVAPNNVGPGLYYWDGAKWIAFAGSPGGLDWSLTGNASTIPGTFAVPGVSYLGTSDANALHITTSGLPRIRVSAAGNVGVGTSSTVTTKLTVDSALATDGTIVATGLGSTAGTLIPTASFANNATDYATAIIAGTKNVPTVATPIIAIRAGSGNYSAAASQTYISPVAQQNIAITANATNLAFYGVTEGITDANRRAAEFRTNDSGVSTNNDTNDPVAYLAGYATGVDVNNGGSIRDLKYGGYFYGGNATSYAYVGARLTTNFTPTTPVAGVATTNFKIIGAGSVSTIVSGAKANDTKKIMFASEAPEVLFEDYGVGQLVNGSVKINIDPIFAKNIFVDEKHPLKVFIQLEGDCNGVYVTSKSKNGFTVKELNKGTSNVNFSWHIVGNRADETEANGDKTNYQSLRYPDAPGPLAQTKAESKMVKPSKTDSEYTK